MIFQISTVIGISELILDFDVEETGSTFEENAILNQKLLQEALNKNGHEKLMTVD